MILSAALKTNGSKDSTVQNVTNGYKYLLYNVRNVCGFVLFTGFSTDQTGFLSLWQTQQSFLLNATGEWTRQHNGYHLGIMRTSSMKWSCGAWQLRTMGEIWAPERALGPCSRKRPERTILYNWETIIWFL